MLLLDLAVPRDIDADVADLQDVFLYTVDDLERAIEDNRRSRREAAEQAEAIIELQTARFVEALARQRPPAPLQRLRAHGETRARRSAGEGAPATRRRTRRRRRCWTCWRTP